MIRRTRLRAEEAARVLANVTPIRVARGLSSIAVQPLEGVTLSGDPFSFRPDHEPHSTLLIFVSATCMGCRDLIAAAPRREVMGLHPDDVVILVFKERSDEAAALAGATLAIASPTAWRNYGVTGPPFFSYIDPAKATVATEGVPWGPTSIADAIEAACSPGGSLDVTRLQPPASDEQ